MFHTEEVGSVVVWTIDRPRQRNALDLATIAGLTTAIRAAATSAYRAAVLTSTNEVFVSGGDLKELRERHSVSDAEQLTDLGAALTSAVVELPFPILCALNGPAIGGGAELAVACDLRVAHSRARIGFKHVRMGVTTSWGTVPRLVALVGAGAAARVLYTAQELPAHEALQIGLYDVVDDEPRKVALAWAEDIAAGAPTAVAAMKQLVLATLDQGEDIRALERAQFVARWSSSDHREAVEAHFGKRPAVFGPR